MPNKLTYMSSISQLISQVVLVSLRLSRVAEGPEASK